MALGTGVRVEDTEQKVIIKIWGISYFCISVVVIVILLPLLI